jgi:predicted DNA-binding ribbon-helix-helix protein
VRDGKESVKFMQVLDRQIFLKLKELARSRGVTVQELIRVLVIPDWMRRSQEDVRRIEDRRRHRRISGPARVPVSAVAAVRRKR